MSNTLLNLSGGTQVSNSSFWPNVVERIRRGDASGMEEMYAAFGKGIRFLLCRQLGPQDLDDKVHDVFVIVVEAICNGELREPERVMAYVHTVVRRLIAGHIDQAVRKRNKFVDANIDDSVSDKHPNPERETSDRQRMALAMSVLKSLPERERGVLTRFYLDEETPEKICRDMDLSETQFRLIKSRAKTRFAELGKRRLAHPIPRFVAVRPEQHPRACSA